MDGYRCTKEGVIATLVTEVQAIKLEQSATKDLIIIVTKLVEQFEVTRSDVSVIKKEIENFKGKPLKIIDKVFYTTLGAITLYFVNRMLGGM